MALTPEQMQRYSRQILLDEVGDSGQEKLRSGSVLILGAGGLGSPAALYLTAAGIGRLGLVDSDEVDLTNLQRQILHFTQDVGRSKVQSGVEKLAQLNPDVKVEIYQIRVDAENIFGLLSRYDFIIDATDNFPTKFLISDACVMAQKPFCHAGVLRLAGQLFTYVPDGNSGCCRCLFSAPPPGKKIFSCPQAGVLGVVPGVIGILQAGEALKYILGQGELLTNRLLIHDAKRAVFRELKFKRVANCPVCGEHPIISSPPDEASAVCNLKGKIYNHDSAGSALR